MLQLSSSGHRTTHLHVHNLLNKLGIIMGNCELLLEEEAASSNAAVRHGLTVMRNTAAEAARQVKEYVRKLDVVAEDLLQSEAEVLRVADPGVMGSHDQVGNVDGEGNPLAGEP